MEETFVLTGHFGFLKTSINEKMRGHICSVIYIGMSQQEGENTEIAHIYMRRKLLFIKAKIWPLG